MVLTASIGASLGSAGIGALGALGSAGIGAFAAGHSAYQQYQYQRSLQEQAAELNYNYNKKYTKWSSKNTPSYNRAGLEKAGYNPLLALGNIGGSSSLGTVTSAGSAGMPDYGEAVNNAFQALNYKKEKEQQEATIDNINQDTKLKEMQGEDLSQDVYMKEYMNQYREEYTNLDLESKRLQNDLINANALGRYLDNEWLPKRYKAEINELRTRGVANSARAYFDTHRALGFTDSYSEDKSMGQGFNPFPGIGEHTNYGHKRSYSHTR